jgi:hypothetical protein
MLMPLGRALIATGSPCVMVVFIALIAVDPDIFSIWRRTAMLVDGRRWTYANRDLRKRSHRAQRESKQYCQCNLLDHELNPPGMVRFRTLPD